MRAPALLLAVLLPAAVVARPPGSLVHTFRSGGGVYKLYDAGRRGVDQDVLVATQEAPGQPVHSAQLRLVRMPAMGTRALGFQLIVDGQASGLPRTVSRGMKFLPCFGHVSFFVNVLAIGPPLKLRMSQLAYLP